MNILKKATIHTCVALCGISVSIAEDEEQYNLSAREEEIKKLSTIVITANPMEPSLLDYGNSISFLEAEQIKPKAEVSLGETLSLEPGVHTSFGGTASSRPVIRGFSGERVRVLRNGIGSLDLSNTSEDHAVTVNPLAIETVEILRGPATLLYGSSAIGGAVNTTDNSISEKGVGRALAGAADLRTRTNDNELSGALKLEGQQGNFNWHVNGFHIDTDNYKIPGNAESARLMQLEEMGGGHDHDAHGHDDHDHDHEEESNSNRLDNSFSTTKGFTTAASYVGERGFFGVSVNGFKSRYGVPGHAHPHDEDEHGHEDEHALDDHEEHSDEHASDIHEDHEHDHHDHDHARYLHGDIDLHDGESVSVSAEDGAIIDLTQYRVDSRGKLKNPTKGIKDVSMKMSFSNYDHSETDAGVIASRYSNDAVEGRVEARHEEISGFKGTVGLQGEYSDFGSDGLEAYLPSHKRYAPAAFLFETFSLSDTVRLEGGSRIEYASLNPNNELESQDFLPLSASTGVHYDPFGDDSYSTALTFAYTERAPSASELFSDGSHFARQIYEVGDTSIGKENSYGVDLALKKNTGLFTGGISLFAQRYENFINLSPEGDEIDGLPVFQYTEVPALFTGFEVENTFHLHEAIGLYAHEFDLGAQVDYVRARDTRDWTNIPRIPPLRTVLKARYGYKDYLSALVEGVFAATYSDTAPNEIGADSYQVLNAQLDIHLPYFKNEKGKSMFSSFYIRGTNLTDEEIRVSTSFIKDLAPLRGRAVLFGIRTVF